MGEKGEGRGEKGREVGGKGEGTGNVVPPCPPPQYTAEAEAELILLSKLLAALSPFSLFDLGTF